jgi:hypothetical protein
MAAATASVARFTLLGLLLTGACGGDDDGGPAGGGPDAAARPTPARSRTRPRRDPHGHRRDDARRTSQQLESRRCGRPDRLDHRRVHPTRVRRASGTGDALGGFTIPDVPVGTYYLQVDDRFLVTSEDSVDLGHASLGRSDAVRATIQPTDLVFDVDNLAPWQPFGDELQMFSAAARRSASRCRAARRAEFPRREHRAGWFHLRRRDAPDSPMLVDGDAGDELYLTQLALTDDGTNRIAG